MNGNLLLKRAKRYAEVIINEFKRIKDKMNLSRYPKTLIVAANTTEANLIKDEIGKLVNNEAEVQVAHYKIDDPQHVIESFKRNKSGILVTVNMADIGFDDPDLEVLILARPITSPVAYVQLRGRVLRKAKDKNNLKNHEGYATIIDLVGKEDLSSLERIYVDHVEQGNFEKRELNHAVDELRGTGTVPVASADVSVERQREHILGIVHRSAKEQSTISPRESSPLVFNILKKKYTIERYLKRKALNICRRSDYTIDCEEIRIKTIIKSANVTRKDIQEKLEPIIREFVEKYIYYDIDELKKEHGEPYLSASSKILVNKLINALLDDAVNKIYKLYLRKHKNTYRKE